MCSHFCHLDGHYGRAMDINEQMDALHSNGYGLGGHMVNGGPWEVTVYRLADGEPVVTLDRAPTWEDAVGQAVSWLDNNPPRAV